jgi:ribosomal protein L7/L12
MPGEYSQESLRAHFENTNKRLAAIEQQLKRLSDVAGLPYATFTEESEVPDEVVQLAGSGDTIGAVKRLRELTGASLEQARDIVAGL